MEFSSSYSRALETMSYRAPIDIYNDCAINSGVYSKYIEIDLSKNYFEFPFALRGYVNSTNLNKHNTIIITKCVNKDYTISASGIETIIKKLFKKASAAINKIQYKDFIYYGTFGWLLDKDFNTLFLITLKGNRETTTSPCVYSGYNIYINPKVFTDAKNPLYKHIISKLLPYYIENDITIFNYYERNLSKDIIIGIPENNYLKHVNKPDTNDLSKKINQIIKENKDIILDLL